MPRGPVARRLILGSARALLGVAAAAWASPSCYAGSSGTNPPPSNFYYPVGLTVSSGGNVLYVVNSDFDLQWNGGTLQSYDLFMIRRHTAELVQANETGKPPMDPVCSISPTTASCIPLVTGYPSPENDAGTAWQSCLPIAPGSGISTANPPYMANGIRVFLNQGCSPPVDSSQPVYFKNSAVIGAFATDLQLSSTGTRLFAPVRGDATVTWAQLTPDDPGKPPPGEPTSIAPASWGPFSFQCAQDQATTGTRCDAAHQAGNDPNQVGNTRNATMPGEPFGIAQTQDGTAMAITHQSTTSTSLLLTGIGDACGDGASCDPSMQFVLDGMPNAGNGITPVPHDPDAVVRCEDVNDQEPCVGQAFLETNHSSAEVDLLRYFDSDGSSLNRPYLEKEQAFPITTNTPGTDERGIVIDPTPSLKCKAGLARLSPPVMCDQPGQAPSQACIQCGQTPSRVFIASRSPPSIIYGEIGQLAGDGDGTFDPDQLDMEGNVPLLAGPSRVYLAPIVDSTGHYALRLFIVCYDTAAVFVFDPEVIQKLGSLAAPETIIYVGAGPFAMAFDSFTLQDVATQEIDAQMGTNLFVVGPDPRQDPTLNLKTYRFGYLATFTNSYLQVIDLDDSLKMPVGAPNAGAPNQQTFEQIVFTLGQLTSPKGQ
jgi:hypothetical protein